MNFAAEPMSPNSACHQPSDAAPWDARGFASQVASKEARPPRVIKEIETYEHAGGTMELVRMEPRPGASRRSKWKEERSIRVWTPRGYNAEHYKNSEHGIPVLYMNDGKNLFEHWLAHQVRAAFNSEAFNR